VAERRNLAAWTALGATYPAFVSINREASGYVSIHVRAPGGTARAEMHMPWWDFQEFVHELNSRTVAEMCRG